MVEVTPDAFEDLVADALDQIPAALTAKMDNVVVVVRDTPPEPGLLGLYEGIPLTDRDGGYTGVLPDRIVVYRLPLCALCATTDDLVRQVRITVIHEVAHHFGIDDERLTELGWD